MGQARVPFLIASEEGGHVSERRRQLEGHVAPNGIVCLVLNEGHISHVGLHRLVHRKEREEQERHEHAGVAEDIVGKLADSDRREAADSAAGANNFFAVCREKF